MIAETSWLRCQCCHKEMPSDEADRARCFECRSPRGKASELFIALRSAEQPSDGADAWAAWEQTLEAQFGAQLSRDERASRATTRRALSERLEGWMRGAARGRVQQHLVGEAIRRRPLDDLWRSLLRQRVGNRVRSCRTPTSGPEAADKAISDTRPPAPPTPAEQEVVSGGPPSIEEMERDTPTLDKSKPALWANSSRLKSHKEPAATSSLRSQRSRGVKTQDGSFGVCEAGRIWRESAQEVWYYVPSLLPVRKREEPLISAALRLTSTVD